jgi:cysteinyl-tRNA synthetase
MLRTHYRQPIDWTARSLEESHKILAGWYPFAKVWTDKDKGGAQPIVDALADDLNTPQAIAELHKLDDAGAQGALGYALSFLGFTGATLAAEQSATAAQRDALAPKVEPMIAARLAARKAKDFKEGDRIRDELAAMGIALKDSKDPKTGEIVTTWEVAR